MATLPAGCPNDPIAALDYLKTRSVLSVEDLKVLAMIETWGEVFYEVLANGVADEESKKLLLRNGAEERGHAHRLLKVLKLKGAAWELPSNEENPFNPCGLGEVPANSELLGMLQQAELNGDEQYQVWADAEANDEVAQLLRLNGREETRHFERVAEVKQRLSIA
jgi:rubrerythrin